MPLAVQQRDVDGVTILEARLSFTRAAESGTKNLLVNLGKVDRIDSTGLGTLVLGHSVMKDAGGAMKLLNLSKRHIELMVVSKLTTVLPIFDDEQLAINSFYPDRDVKRFDILEFVQSQESKDEHPGNAPLKPREA